MPRDSSGNYTLVSGNPVVNGTTIASTWGNNTLNDIANVLTASLDRSGNGGMLAPLKIVDGAVGGAGLAFTSEPTTGIYRPAASQIGIAVSGTNKVLITTTTITLNASITNLTAGTLALSGIITASSPSGTPLTVNQANNAAAVAINTSATAGNYGLLIAGTAGAAVAQSLLAVQQNGFSNGFTVATDGTNMKYGFVSGNVTIGLPISGNALTITGNVTQFALVTQAGGSQILAHSIGTSGISWNWIVGNVTANALSLSTGSINDVIKFTSSGAVVIGNANAGVALTVNGVASNFTASFLASTGAGTSFGPLIQGGTNSSDRALTVQNASGGSNFLQIFGDGGIVIGAPTGANQGTSTVNAQGLFVNGAAVSVGATGNFTATYNCGGASPTGTAQYRVVNNQVTLYLPAVVGAGAGTAFTITGLPAGIQPARTQYIPVGGSIIQNNGIIVSQNPYSLFLTASSGTITFQPDGGYAGFSGASARGLANPMVITYMLN